MDSRPETDSDGLRRKAQPARGVFIESSQLFADRNEVKIHHDGKVYRLRLTKNGKLILNK